MLVLRRAAAIVGCALVALSLVAIAYYSWENYRRSNSDATIDSISGFDIVGHNNQTAMIATLPASLADEVVVPLAYQYGTDGGLIYRGEQPLRWNFYGNTVLFDFQGLDYPDDYVGAALVTMSSDSFDALVETYTNANTERLQLQDTMPASGYNVLALEDLLVVGA